MKHLCSASLHSVAGMLLLFLDIYLFFKFIFCEFLLSSCFLLGLYIDHIPNSDDPAVLQLIMYLLDADGMIFFFNFTIFYSLFLFIS